MFKLMNIFIVSVVLTIVFNINNQILIAFGQYVPAPRYAASSEIIGDRLYVIGGQVSIAGIYLGSDPSRVVIYLDLSKDFNSNSPPWVDYSNISPLPVLNSWADSCKDKDNKTIYVFGGIIYDAKTNSYITDNNKQLYVFDSVKNAWTIPVVNGTSAPARRREMKVVMDDLGKMYVFGGGSDQYTGSNIITFHNDMTIFNPNPNLLNWTAVNPPNLTGRADFTATYLPKNKLIIYIGGSELSANRFLYSVDINQVAD